MKNAWRPGYRLVHRPKVADPECGQYDFGDACLTVAAGVLYNPASKDGSEPTVKVAKADRIASTASKDRE